MKPIYAARLINALVYKPGWTIHAEPWDRFEHAVKVSFTYPAMDSGSHTHPFDPCEGYVHEIPGGARAAFIIPVGDLSAVDDCALYRRLLEKIVCIESHEAREFLRVASTGVAPFHPHSTQGMFAWGEVESDLAFGNA